MAAEEGLDVGNGDPTGRHATICYEAARGGLESRRGQAKNGTMAAREKKGDDAGPGALAFDRKVNAVHSREHSVTDSGHVASHEEDLK